MKTLTTFFLIISLLSPTAWGENCDKAEQYHTIIEELKEEIALLEEENNLELSRSKMNDILIDTHKTGSELLQEQEDWEAIVEISKNRKREATWFMTIYGSLLGGITWLNYRLYAKPPKAIPVFPNIFFTESMAEYCPESLRVFSGFSWPCKQAI